MFAIKNIEINNNWKAIMVDNYFYANENGEFKFAGDYKIPRKMK